MTDNEIIELFFARSERGITELDVKYGERSRALSRNIVGNNDFPQKALTAKFMAERLL